MSTRPILVQLVINIFFEIKDAELTKITNNQLYMYLNVFLKLHFELRDIKIDVKLDNFRTKNIPLEKKP